MCASRHLLCTVVFRIVRIKHYMLYDNYSILLGNTNQVNSVWSVSEHNAQGRNIFLSGRLAPRPGTGDMRASRHLLYTVVFRIVRIKHCTLYDNYSILLCNMNQVTPVWSVLEHNAQGRNILEWSSGPETWHRRHVCFSTSPVHRRF